MTPQEKDSKAADTFNEGEFLKDFKGIEDALEENMRAEQDKVFGRTDEGELPFTSIEQLVNQRTVKHPLNSSEESLEQEPSSGSEVPFASSDQPIESKPFQASSPQPEAVLYRQARSSRRSRKGRQGIWRFLPHIGHRRRHWIQRNFSRLIVVLMLALALAGFYLVRIHPRLALAALDEMASATRAHDEGDYEQAVALYQRFLQNSPEMSLRTIQAHYYLGCCYENTGEWKKAEAEYRWVHRAYHQYCENLPLEHLERRQYDHNIPDVFANAIYTLGQLAWQHEEKGKAGECFHMLLEEFPNYAFASEVKERLDRLEREEGRVSQAIETSSLETKGQGDGSDRS